jgi:serine/threonine protein kinase
MIRESTETGVVIDIPRQFNQYTYIQTIGCASTAVVILVSDRFGERYAAKVLSRTGLIKEGRLEYFERELRLLEFVHHPNIIRLLETVYLPDIIIMITEYCEHGDLFDYLVQKGPLRPSMVRSFLYQLVKALECLHETGFAHRDLKPENIFVDRESHVKLGDFGLAKQRTADGLTNTICGTLSYSAPEILRGESYDGRKADIWSLGVIIYVMTMRTLPWDPGDSQTLVAQITHSEIQFPPGFPNEIASVIHICTSLVPAKRPTPTDILELPWVSDEKAAWTRVFGLGARTASLDKMKVGSFKPTGAARASAKLILKTAGRQPVERKPGSNSAVPPQVDLF